MTITSLATLELPSSQLGVAGGDPAFTSFLLDASGEKYAVVMQAPKTGSIRKVHFRTATVTTPTDTDVRLETVSTANGDPTGTLFGTTTNVTVASGSITSDTWVTTGALTADASVTRGDIFAVVIAPSGSPNYNIAGAITSAGANQHIPYTDHFTSAWAKGNTPPVIAVEYSDGSFAYTPWCLPASAINKHTINTGTTPDEIALKFTLPAPVRVSGLWLSADHDGDMDAILYSSDGSTVLASVSLDKDIRRSASFFGSFRLMFATQVSLSASTVYYLALKPTSVTSINIYSFDVASAGVLDAVGGGQDMHYAAQTDAGGFSATTTRRPFWGLVIDGIDDGAGSGGGAGPLIGGRLVG